MPKEWADRYQGQFDDGWDAYRERVFARQKELGIMPADAELSRHDPDVPDWESLSPDARRLAARMMEVFAGFLSHTDHHIGRLLDFLRETGELDNTLIMVVSDNGASAEGGPAGTTNETAVLQQRAGAAGGQPGPDRRARRPDHLQPLPVGLDLGGQHAVPPVEAGDLPRRHVRPVPGPLAAAASAPAVRCAPSTRTSSTWCPPCSTRSGSSRRPPIRGVTQSPIHGVSFAHTFDDADAATRHRTQYFEMFGHRAIDHDGWRAVCPWPGPSFAEAGKPFGTPITGRGADRPGRQLTGSSTTSPRTSPRTTTSPTSTGTSSSS